MVPHGETFDEDRQAAVSQVEIETDDINRNVGFQKCLEEGEFGDDSDGITRACGLHNPVLPTFTSGPLAAPEVANLCSVISANPRAFDEWLALIKQVEVHGTVVERCSMYEIFLVEFPLCWGYWKRLAELQARECGRASGLQVYERALAIAPACVDLWVQYCEAVSMATEAEEESIRMVFEKAVGAVGDNWRAFPLWDLYFTFEEKRRCWKRLGSLLQRALAIPMHGSPAVRVRLRSLILGDASPPVEELCSEAEASRLDRPQDPASGTHEDETMPGEAGESNGASSAFQCQVPAAEPKTAPSPAPAREMEDGEITEAEDSEDDGEIPEAASLPAPAALQQLTGTKAVSKGGAAAAPAQELDASDRAKHFLNLREELCSKTASEAAVLARYEEPLHRQYFHNKPLSVAQLDAWRTYLTFEESRQPRDWKRLCALFDRCLIVTNNYLEFWLRYARALQDMEGELYASSKPEAACNLFRGACVNGRLSRRPDALAAWAELEEQCGRLHRAGALLDAALHTCGHGAVELMLRRVALKRRTSDAASAASLLEHFALRTFNLKSRSLLCRRYARITEDGLGQTKKAAEFLMDAWKVGCRDPGLLMELASLIMRTSPGRENTDGEGADELSTCMALFEEALHDAVSGRALNASVIEEAFELWACYVDFLLTYGASMQILQNVQDRARSFRCQAAQATAAKMAPATPAQKKRGSTDLSPEKTSNAAAWTALKQARSNAASSPAFGPHLGAKDPSA